MNAPPARRRPGPAPRLWALSLAVGIAVTLGATLPVMAAADRSDGGSATVSAKVSVAVPGTFSASGVAVAAEVRTSSPRASTYRVTPTVVVEGNDGGRLVAQGSVVRTSTGPAIPAGVRGQLEPFSYTDLGDGTILIDPAWVGRHIVTETVPVLGQMRCHRAVFPQLVGALTEITAAGLDHLIDAGDYGGCWVPRRIDWSPDRPLSMHAWGIAFDINVATNGLGAQPTLDRRIVDILERWGFAWGGHWGRPDGMHFELARIDAAGG